MPAPADASSGTSGDPVVRIQRCRETAQPTRVDKRTRHVRLPVFPPLGSPACDISDFSAVSPIVDAPSVKPGAHRRESRPPPKRNPRRGTTPLHPNRNGNPPSGRQTEAGLHHDSPDGVTRTCPAASRCRVRCSICRRCASVVDPQTAISSRERRQPRHTAVISWSWQTPVQGDSIMVSVWY